MSKITGSFLALVFLIIFSSIVYIWKADAEKRALESQIQSQHEQISDLKTRLEQQQTPVDIINAGEVSGEILGDVTPTGSVTGSVTLNNPPEVEAVIVCMLETKTKQESCNDYMIESDKTIYNFTFDIPQGTYEIYAILPPSETKVYYSDVNTCDQDGNCTSNAEKKRLIQVSPEETQQDINIYL